MAAAPLRTLRNTALFICDLQEKFRPAIHEFPRVIATAQKMLRATTAGQILDIPVFATTQNRARLGETCSDLRLDVPGGFATKIHADKTLFSMWTPEVKTFFSSGQKHAIVIVGIESHICVLQTTLDLLREGHKVYVLADGVSSCNKEEVPIALARLRAEGAVITTSESFIYERMGDAGIAGFKEMANLVKETKESTSQTLQALRKF
ncbi:Isochorismatase-like protein [Phyllosticta citriasiana]|uniref:Isochorismatase-like protein n=1 Tax=Phyllosticta citriasiana TaxID=595635 RepID=A0ABR1KLX4_9PEZI